jgi:hypothetical protein
VLAAGFPDAPARAVIRNWRTNGVLLAAMCTLTRRVPPLQRDVFGNPAIPGVALTVHHIAYRARTVTVTVAPAVRTAVELSDRRVIAGLPPPAEALPQTTATAVTHARAAIARAVQRRNATRTVCFVISTSACRMRGTDGSLRLRRQRGQVGIDEAAAASFAYGGSPKLAAIAPVTRP